MKIFHQENRLSFLEPEKYEGHLLGNYSALQRIKLFLFHDFYSKIS